MKIALVGNQNSGKTTLFNALTGANHKIGNWPGVTVERKSGKIRETNLEIVDLPGVYSLSPYSIEEEISRSYVFQENPDLIINIIDGTSIERNLYLTTQLLECNCNVIVALNMADILEKKGIEVDEKKLSFELGATVIKISALKKTGIETLIDCIKSESFIVNQQKKIFPLEIEQVINKIESALQSPHKRFVAVKLIENDKIFRELQTDEITLLRNKLEESFGVDGEQLIADERYNYIISIKEKCVVKKEVKKSWSEKLDKVFLNRVAAIPIFAVIMFLIYFLAVGLVGSATVDWVDGLVGKFSNWFGGILKSWNASPWAISLVIDGIVAGVGAMLNFVPQLIILFLCISLLETTGYMSRISFVLDRVFIKLGLSGKSLIPFIVGSGCSVPGIMATRTIEDENERKMTLVLTPFVPCSAKLPIIALFAGYFFAGSSGWVSASLYFFAIIVIIISALFLKRFVFKNVSPSAYISELPEYKAPSVKYVARDVFDRTWSFIKRAGTIILLCSVAVWFLVSFNWRMQYGVDVEESMLADIGNAIAWLFYPMLGEWSWGASVSAIQGLIAKEQVVSSLEVIAGVAEGGGAAVFGTSLFSFFNGASAYAYMVFNLFSAPCVAAIAATRKELGSTKKMLLAVVFQTGIALVLSYAVFGIGSLIMLI